MGMTTCELTRVGSDPDEFEVRSRSLGLIGYLRRASEHTEVITSFKTNGSYSSSDRAYLLQWLLEEHRATRNSRVQQISSRTVWDA